MVLVVGGEGIVIGVQIVVRGIVRGRVRIAVVVGGGCKSRNSSSTCC